MFDKLTDRPVLLICGQNKVETGSKEKEKFVSLYNSIIIPTSVWFLLCILTSFLYVAGRQ